MSGVNVGSVCELREGKKHPCERRCILPWTQQKMVLGLLGKQEEKRLYRGSLFPLGEKMNRNCSLE